MLSILHDFRKELEKNKAELLAHDFTVEIENAVEDYRKELIATKENERNQAVAKIDSDIDCVDRVIKQMVKTQGIAEEALHSANTGCVPDGFTVKTIS